ncbi:prolyl aminopeptidase [Pendulispora rubella]|uniref:Proline iminopeptidase n=1 Tax=Pendulispora rubella TaxID=2741070 RepID=A0ABZ2KXY9_9BACT
MRKTLYPPIEPHSAGRLAVSGGHEIYWEVSGNPKGKPVLFVHGGPGGATEPRHRRFFDPTRYRIVLFDQRGCGKSTPHASLEQNTTWHLVDDMEALRVHLGIDAWQLFGGSWGSTLSLAYAQRHPERVTEMVLRGIFLARASEIAWFNQSGASAIFPDAWEDFVAPIPQDERHDLVHAFYKRLTDDDPKVQSEAARAWAVWESRTISLLPDRERMARSTGGPFAVAIARLECHYSVHGAFFGPDTALLDGVNRIRHLPATIVHGRYDVICPLQNAWALHRAWPEARFEVVEDAGHSVFEPGILHQVVEATDRYR